MQNLESVAQKMARVIALGMKEDTYTISPSDYTVQTSFLVFSKFGQYKLVMTIWVLSPWNHTKISQILLKGYFPQVNFEPPPTFPHI